MKKLLIALLSISILAAVGCGDPNEERQPFGPSKEEMKAAREAALKKVVEDNKEDIKKLATTYSDIGKTGYGAAVKGAEELKAAINTLAKKAEAFRGDPLTADLTTDLTFSALNTALLKAQQAWRDSRPAYLQTEVFRFYGGPINQENPNYNITHSGKEVNIGGEIEPLVNAWPIDESYIDYTCLYAGNPISNAPGATLPDGAPDGTNDKYYCSPLNMKKYDNCTDATIPQSLKDYAKAAYPSITDWDNGDGKTKLDAIVAKAKANACYLPNLISAATGTTPPKFYATTNMLAYEASLLGRTKLEEVVEGNVVDSISTNLDVDYSALSDDEKKKIQLIIRSLGGGNPVAGQNYGKGETGESGKCEEEGQQDSEQCHHISQSDANVSTGYHALEFLLWGQDFNSAGPGARPLADFAMNGATTGKFTDEAKKSAKRRLVYLQAVADMLVEDLKYVAGQWKNSTNDNYRKRFVELANTKPHEVLDKIFAGMYLLSVDETGGERIQPAIRLQNQEEEHSCFSDNTQVDMQMDIQGIVNVFEGYYNTWTCKYNQEYCEKSTNPTDPKVAQGTGMKVILSKFAELCKNLNFSGEDYCKGKGAASVTTLGNGLQTALTDAIKLLNKGEDGAKYFDQEVFEYWPIGTKKVNPGHERLSKLGNALSSLKTPYVSFVDLIGIQLPAEE